MKIAVFSPSAPTKLGGYGGAQLYILKLAEKLQSRGHEVIIFGGNQKSDGVSLPKFEVISGVQIKRVGLQPFPFIGLVWKFIRERSKHHLFIENIMTYPLYLPFFTSQKSKVISLKHHFLGEEASKILNPIKRVLNKINEDILIPLLYTGERMFVPSEATAQYLKKKSDKFIPIKVIPPGIMFIKTQMTKSDVPLILYVGSLRTNRKKVDDLIEAFKIVNKMYQDAELVIIGEGKDKDMLMAQSKGLPVKFPGFLAEKEKHEWFDKAWVFASPSLKEGFGITWIEANSHGLPVVTYENDLGTIDNSSGMMVKKGDINALATSLIHLIEDENERISLGIAGRTNAKQYTWENTSKSFVKYFLKD